MDKLRIANAPQNAGILSYLARPDAVKRSKSLAEDRLSCAVDEVKNPYYELGTHPEIVEYLWDEISRSLPVDCRWVVRGAPALVCPATGIVFAFAGGTGTVAIRLPVEDHATALAAGARTSLSFRGHPEIGIAASVLVAAAIGPGWLFAYSMQDVESWIAAAYEYAEAG